MSRIAPTARNARYWMKELAYGTASAVTRVRAPTRHPSKIILTYHSHSVSSPWGVGIADFERHVSYLRERFHLVPLQELASRFDDSSEPMACLTFDDGYLDNCELTLGVLDRHDVNATFFLIASALGARLPGRSGEALMSADQARDLVARGHEVGSHTLSHADLVKIPRHRARTEIAESRIALEDLLSVPVTSIAYPFGRYDADTKLLAQQAGCRLGVTTREASVSNDPDRFALPRVSVNRDVGAMQFRAKLTPALEVYESWRGRRREGTRA